MIEETKNHIMIQPVLLYLFFLNVVSNLSFCLYDHSKWALLCMLSTSAIISLTEFFILKDTKHYLGKMLSCVLIIAIIVIHNIIIIIDYFLITNFHMLLNQDVMDILAETNGSETSNFINTYINYKTVSIFILLIATFNYTCWKTSVVLSSYKRSVPFFFGITSILGLFVICRMVYSFALYRDGLSVPQYIAPLRIIYAGNILNQRTKEIKNLCLINASWKAENTLGNHPNIVVIIGESFSKFHCSLYNYQKQTFPLLESRRENGEILVFRNAVCIADATHKNMKAIFSLAKKEQQFGDKPLFPGVFRASGYKTQLLDNQYFINQGNTFLTDSKLSEILWDNRNNKRYQFDGDLIEEMHINDQPSLIVFHLMGQHYQYEQRYPQEFKFFTADNYSGTHSPEQREIIAHYDNANLYNDYVINQIIKKFEDKNCIIVYFSDHGEEVFELSNFMGHGTSMSSTDYKYQLSVPFIIWTSQKYRDNYPQIMEKLSINLDTPIFTKDISHFLIDLAGIKTADYLEELSFINEKYDKNKHRIVMNSFDYDKNRD